MAISNTLIGGRGQKDPVMMYKKEERKIIKYKRTMKVCAANLLQVQNVKRVNLSFIGLLYIQGDYNNKLSVMFFKNELFVLLYFFFCISLVGKNKDEF